MTRKALHLVVNLEIQAVTCPGVWLCPNGNVQLLFSMLGKEVQTIRLPPVFPLLFHEKVTIQKTFPNAGCLAEVQDCLAREDVYAVLLQEVEDSKGGVAVHLARFHSSALHILYPSPCAKGLLAGVDVDLLMEASTDYPGILSPKIELSTKTLVKEVASIAQEGYIINPKTLSSQKMLPLSRQNTEKEVKTIHSDGQHKTYLRYQDSSKGKHNGSGLGRSVPTFQKCESNTNFRSHLRGHGNCSRKCSLHESMPDNNPSRCSNGHQPSMCPLCTKYRAIFGPHSDSKDTLSECRDLNTEVCRRNHTVWDSFEKTKRLSKALHTHVDHILEPSLNHKLRDNYQALSSYLTQIPFQAVPDNLQKHSLPQKSNYDETQNQVSYSDPCFQVSCGSGDESNSHRQMFYANLERFYRKLYDRAKMRAQVKRASDACEK